MNMKFALPRRKIFLLFCVFMILIMNAPAQNITVVTGTVTNENGELLTGVIVKATAAKESYTTVTNEKGLFGFSKLKAGTSYTLTASYVGYQQNAAAVIVPGESGSNSVLI